MTTPNRLAKIAGPHDDAFPQHYSQLTDTVNWILRNMPTTQPAAAAPASSKLTKNEAAAIAIAKGL